MKKNLLVALPFIGTAVMLTVIQAPIDLAPLAWVSFVPFIIACSSTARPRRLILFGYVISLCYWLGNLYWLIPATIVGWIAFCLCTAALWPILALCLRFCRAKKIPLFFASAILIVGIERMQGIFFGGFFWRFLAHSQYQNVTLIQIADIFGAGGVSFLIAMVNGLLAELIITVRRKKILTLVQFAGTVIVCAAVVATFAYGWWRIDQEQECVTEGPLAASLQSNVPQSVKRTFESGDELFDGLMEQSKAADQAGAELIVWPETMVQARLNPEVLRLLEPSDPWNVFDKRLREHSKDTAFVLVGALGGVPEILFRENLEIHFAKKYNSAFLYNIDGTKSPESYNKIHLVPFSEFQPLRKSMAWFYKLLTKIKFIPYNFDYSLDKGTEYTVFEMDRGQGKDLPTVRDDVGIQASQYRFAVIICYEGTVPYVTRKFALDEHGRKRIDWLVNISNDGWFVRFKDEQVLPSAELAQHAAVYAFRAVENRLAILRSVNTGISCLIDSAGRIRNGFLAGNLPVEAKARTGMPGWFVDRIPIDNRATIFSKYGEWLDFSCEVCVILLIIVLLSGKLFRKKNLLIRDDQMASEPTKDKTQKHRKKIASVVYALLFACVTLFAFGCEDPSKSTLGDYDVTNIASPRAEADRIIQNALSDTNPVARVNAIEVIATTGQLKLMPNVQRLLQDEFTPVRFAAALAVGDTQYSPAKDLVSPLLKDKDVNVIIAASYAMGRLGSVEYFKVIRKALNSNDQTVKSNAAFLLGKAGGKDSLSLLKSAQEDKNTNDMVRFQILEARARLGDNEVLQKLWAIVYSAFADDRIMGIRAMGLLGTSKARDILVTKLDDNILEVRLAAAGQLGRLRDRIGETEVLDVFEKNLTAGLDTEAVERANVLTALAIGEICTPDLEKFLPQLLKNESKFVRIAAAKAVFQCKMN